MCISIYVDVKIGEVYFADTMVRPVVKNYNERGEMEIKKLAVSSSMKESLRAPTIWEKPASAMYDYHNQISGLYYQVSQEQATSGSFNMFIQRIV